MDGFLDADWHMEKIRNVAGNYIEAMTPTVYVPAMLSFQDPLSDQTITQPIRLIGIDPETQGAVSDFGKYLQHPANRENLSFDLRPQGYDTTGSPGCEGRRGQPQWAQPRPDGTRGNCSTYEVR